MVFGTSSETLFYADSNIFTVWSTALNIYLLLSYSELLL